jgi:uncharacterized protein (DUF2147 family)
MTMKYLFVCALAALMVVGAEAADNAKKAKAKGNPIAKLDTDKDGKVSQAEFVASQMKAYEKAEKEFDADKSAATFAKKDKNSDGFLTLDEIKAAPKGKKAPKNDAADEE